MPNNRPGRRPTRARPAVGAMPSRTDCPGRGSPSRRRPEPSGRPAPMPGPWGYGRPTTISAGWSNGRRGCPSGSTTATTTRPTWRGTGSAGRCRVCPDPSHRRAEDRREAVHRAGGRLLRADRHLRRLPMADRPLAHPRTGPGTLRRLDRRGPRPGAGAYRTRPEGPASRPAGAGAARATCAAWEHPTEGGQALMALHDEADYVDRWRADRQAEQSGRRPRSSRHEPPKAGPCPVMSSRR